MLHRRASIDVHFLSVDSSYGSCNFNLEKMMLFECLETFLCRSKSDLKKLNSSSHICFLGPLREMKSASTDNCLPTV